MNIHNLTINLSRQEIKILADILVEGTDATGRKRDVDEVLCHNVEAKLLSQILKITERSSLAVDNVQVSFTFAGEHINGSGLEIK